MQEFAAEGYEPESPVPPEHNVFASSPKMRGLTEDQIEKDFLEEKNKGHAKTNSQSQKTG